jgi:DNA-directed RNA polymerase subunit RPC12/RpoP
MAAEKVRVYHCTRCGEDWPARKKKHLGAPKYCPRCHSPYWNKKRKYHLAYAGGTS